MTTNPAEPGDRIELIHTGDYYTHLKEGALGTVTSVDDIGTHHVKWDDGSTLGLVPAAGDTFANLGKPTWHVWHEGDHQAGPMSLTEANRYVLRHQPQSVDWATTHGGWAILQKGPA